MKKWQRRTSGALLLLALFAGLGYAGDGWEGAMRATVGPLALIGLCVLIFYAVFLLTSE